MDLSNCNLVNWFFVQKLDKGLVGTNFTTTGLDQGMYMLMALLLQP